MMRQWYEREIRTGVLPILLGVLVGFSFFLGNDLRARTVTLIVVVPLIIVSSLLNSRREVEAPSKQKRSMHRIRLRQAKSRVFRWSDSLLRDLPEVDLRAINPDAATDVELLALEVDELQAMLAGSRLWRHTAEGRRLRQDASRLAVSAESHANSAGDFKDAQALPQIGAALERAPELQPDGPLDER
jgi:hypothetical protein